MAGVTTTGSAKLHLLVNSSGAAVPYSATALLDLLNTGDVAYSGVEAFGSSSIALLATLNESGGVAASGSALLNFTLSKESGTTGLGLSGSAFIDFSTGSSQVFDGSTGSASLALLGGSASVLCGTSASGSVGIQFAVNPTTINSGIATTGAALIVLSAQGIAVSTINLYLANPAEIDTLELPFVGFSMNVLTRGVTAYTANVNGEVPWVIATAVNDFGTRKRKYMTDLYAHLRTGGDVDVSVMTDEDVARKRVATIPYADKDGVYQRRARMPRNLVGTNWQLFFEGTASVTLKSAEPRIVKSDRTI